MPTISELIEFTQCSSATGPIDSGLVIQNAKTPTDADERSICWAKPGNANVADMMASSKARVFIVAEAELENFGPTDKVLLAVQNPRLTFLQVVERYFVTKPEPGIHPTAFVHELAKIGENVHIGPFCYVGKSEVGDGSVLHGHVHVYDNVRIGQRVSIHSGTVIGADGFGFQKDEQGNVHKFPHIGGVTIEDDVEIGSNSCIDKGTLGNTLLKKSCKIDNLVHIAHNVTVGERAFVIANAMVGGSTEIGEGTWIAPSVSLMNGLKIGKNATVGMAALVTKPIPDGETWTGLPARPLREFVDLQKKLKNL